MASETFSPAGLLRPDWNLASDWSGGSVPGAGTTAVVNAVDVLVDPQETLAADIVLEGGGGLIGNGGGFRLAPESTLLAKDYNALDGNGAIVNQGVITVADAATLSVVVGAGSDIAMSYGLAVPSFENTGSVVIAGGTLAIDGTEFSNTGTVLVADGVLSVTGGWVDGGQGQLAPGGEIDISRGGDAGFGDGVVDQIFNFGGPGTIAFNDPGDVTAVAIAGFGYRDEILTGSMAEAKNLLANGLIFTTPLPPGTSLAVEQLGAGAAIVLENDATAPCFARGTGVLTPAGYVPVEALRPGESVVTAAGATRQIHWVGRRTIDLATHARPAAARPIHIMPNALEPGRPAKRLTLSPDHALYLHGQLVPVKLLTNGATIIRDDTCLAVTYFHIELDRHDILVAENLAVESYLDTGNRAAFEGTGTPWQSPVFGRGRQWDARAHAPLCLSGPVLKQCRQEVFRRALALGFLQKQMPEVHLMMDGARVPRTFGVTSLPCFRLPENHGGQVEIRSESFIPAEMSCGREAEDDYRRLGIAIRRIRVDHNSHHAETIALTGFHPRGQGDIAAWTTGKATIAIPTNASIIALNIIAFPRGWQRPLGVWGAG